MPVIKNYTLTLICNHCGLKEDALRDPMNRLPGDWMYFPHGRTILGLSDVSIRSTEQLAFCNHDHFNAWLQEIANRIIGEKINA